MRWRLHACESLLGVIFETVPWMWAEARQAKHHQHAISLSLAACPSPGPRVCHVNPSLDAHWIIHTQTPTDVQTGT